jgi:hypothetical protein
MSLPSGMIEIGTILKSAIPSGMPMIVRQSSTPDTMCATASHQPARITHTTFPRNAHTPEFCFSTIVRPNGHRAYAAMRNDAIPHGIVTMSTHSRMPAAT